MTGSSLPTEAWLLLVGIAAIGIAAMLLTMAAAIRHGVRVVELEHRVKHLRAQQRQNLIERGLIEPDDGEVIEVEEVIDDEPIGDAGTGRMAA